MEGVDDREQEQEEEVGIQRVKLTEYQIALGLFVLRLP